MYVRSRTDGRVRGSQVMQAGGGGVNSGPVPNWAAVPGVGTWAYGMVNAAQGRNERERSWPFHLLGAPRPPRQMVEPWIGQ